MVLKMLFEALVLVGSLASTDLKILHEYSSFLSDGSMSEGVGYYDVQLSPEYLGQDAPVDDYSLSLCWPDYCCLSYDANSMLQLTSATKLTYFSSLWSSVGSITTVSTSLTVAADFVWHYVGMTHCISNKNLLLCRDGQCSNAVYKTRDPLTTAMSLFIGRIRPMTYFLGRVGDMVLTINKCMSLLDFSTRLASKAPLPFPLVPYGGVFYDANVDGALLVPLALPGQSDLSTTSGVLVTSTDKGFLYGRTLSTTEIVFAGYTLGVPYVNIHFVTGESLELSTTVTWNTPGNPAVYYRVGGIYFPVTSTGSTTQFSCSSASFQFTVWRLKVTGASTDVNFYCGANPSQWIGATSLVLGSLSMTDFAVAGVKMYNYWVLGPTVPLAVPAGVQSAVDTYSPKVASVNSISMCSYTGSLVCAGCPSGYFMVGQRCIKCHWACVSCTGAGYAACNLCTAGYFSQPGNPSLCLPQCPFGYTATAAQTCALGPNPDIDVQFDNNLAGDITLPSGLRVQLGWDPSRFYPDFDFLDPIPVRYRGVFYNISESISLPNYNGNNNHLVLHSDFSVDMWVLPYSYGNLFRVNTNNGWEDDDLLIFGISWTYINWPQPETQNVLSFGMKTYQQSFTFYQTSLVLPTIKTEWYHLGFTIKYDSVSQTTTVIVFKNSETATLTFPSFFSDTSAARHNIGFLCRYISGYLGYIYKFRVGNVAKTMVDFASLRGQACTGCSVCPASTNTCLSICKFTEYVDSTGSCRPCMQNCKYGCARGDSCNLCDDPLCLKCTTFDAGTCLVCYPGASFVNGLCQCDPGKFVMGEKCSDQCDSGYYLDTTKAACQPCANGCAECTASTCTQCAPDLFFENGACSCGEGWFVGSHSDCIRCDAVCKRCRGSASSCSECYTEYGYYLSGSECKDCRKAPGYIGGLGKANVVTAGLSLEATLNAVCQEKCGDGVVKGQLGCDDGNIKDGDGCSSLCEIEHGWDCINRPGLPSSCKDDKPPEAQLSYSKLTSNGYELIFSFSETVRFLSPVNSLTSVTIANTVLFSYTFEAISNSGQLFSPFLLKVESSESIKAGTRITVTVSDTSKVIDSVNNSLITRKVSTTLTDGYLTSVSQGVATAVSGLGGAIGGVVGIALVTSMFGGANLGVMWMLLESLQIINYIVYMSVDFPDNLRTFLHVLQFANFNFIPNFFAMFSEDSFGQPPVAFVAEDVNTDFFQNCGQIFTIWVSLGLLFCIVTTLSRIIPLNKRLLKWKRQFIYSVPLRFSIESFLELSLAVFLQIRDPIPGAAIGYFSVVSAFAVLGYLTLSYYLTIGKVALQSTTRLREKRHKRLFGTLYSEFRLDRKVTRAFLVVQNLRRLLYVLSLIFLTDSPAGQSVLIALITAGVATALYLVHPYKNLWLGNRVEIACEGVLFLAMGMVTGFNVDMTRESREALGWGVIGLLVTVIGIHFIATVMMQYRDVVSLVKRCSKNMVKRAAERQRRKVLGRKDQPQVWPFEDEHRAQAVVMQSIGKSIPDMPMLPTQHPKQPKSPSDSPPEEDSGEIQPADS